MQPTWRCPQQNGERIGAAPLQQMDRQTGLGLGRQDKKEEDWHERRKPRLKSSIENWLHAVHTLAYMFVEKFPQAAAALFLNEQKIQAAQLKYQGEAWLKYNEGFRAKMLMWHIIDWDPQDVAGFTEHMVTAQERVESHEQGASGRQIGTTRAGRRTLLE
ncbi:hypothetical protein NDU88_010971 [Pleurodeles waltl]|uniref:Retrotransposon gag domain-containing protein n=1 Tax=Pleurodeles waltl TaxID=8319 RepID=A0AAV7S4S5_PLEWA|nr:hypothetical protein NDU88_010971 [Pleurodeles waltl]